LDYCNSRFSEITQGFAMSKSKDAGGGKQLPLDFDNIAHKETPPGEMKQITVAVRNASVHSLNELRVKRQITQEKSAIEVILSHARKLTW
jgi:hypothetical protein